MVNQQPEPQKSNLTMSDLVRWGNTLLSIATPIIDALAMTWIRIREEQIRRTNGSQNESGNRAASTTATGSGSDGPVPSEPQSGQSQSQGDGVPRRPATDGVQLRPASGLTSGWPHK